MAKKFQITAILLMFVIGLVAGPGATTVAYNCFFFLDNLLVTPMGISPIILWGILGLLIGSTIGVLVAVKKLKLQKSLVLYPIGLLSMIIIVLMFFQSPLAFPSGGFPSETTNETKEETVVEDVRPKGTWIVSLGTFRIYTNAKDKLKSLESDGVEDLEMIDGDNYSRLSKGTHVVSAGKNMTQNDANELMRRLRGMGVIDIAVIDAGQFRRGDSSVSSKSEPVTDETGISGGRVAVIKDADGYTNLRQGKGTNYNVVKEVHSNEIITVFPSEEIWWLVKTEEGLTGYMFRDRIELLDKEFYVIAVSARKSETAALAEVRDLVSKGYRAGHLWIPHYKSLSGAALYSVYLGPYDSRFECQSELDKVHSVFPEAYGLLVSQGNRVEIRPRNEKAISATDSNRGRIKGSGVIIRENHSIRSKSMGSFENSGEFVRILDKFQGQNSNEAMLVAKSKVNVGGEIIVLDIGKAVTIISSDSGTALVSFEDGDKNSMRARISLNLLEVINDGIWYKIQRDNNQRGWVFEKFIVVE